jgi:hypothetical protein
VNLRERLKHRGPHKPSSVAVRSSRVGFGEPTVNPRYEIAVANVTHEEI